MDMAKRCLLALIALSTALALAAPAAQAGPLVKSAGDCSTAAVDQPFLRWLDPLHYALVPGGSFENGAPGWSLGTAQIVSGNEPFNDHGAGDSKSLAIPRGGSVTSPVVCVGLDKPFL